MKDSSMISTQNKLTSTIKCLSQVNAGLARAGALPRSRGWGHLLWAGQSHSGDSDRLPPESATEQVKVISLGHQGHQFMVASLSEIGHKASLQFAGKDSLFQSHYNTVTEISVPQLKEINIKIHWLLRKKNQHSLNKINIPIPIY